MNDWAPGFEWWFESSSFSSLPDSSEFCSSTNRLTQELIPPLVFFPDVSVNGKPCDCDVIVDCKVGDSVNLEVKLTNLSKNLVGPLALTVVPYQDYQNGVQIYDLEEAVTFIGSNTFYIETVSGGWNLPEDISHSYIT